MFMSKVKKVSALEVLDSRGHPTVKVKVETRDGYFGDAMVPSGASTGKFEALEIRDKDEKIYGRKGVTKAVNNVNNQLSSAIEDLDVTDQGKIDEALIKADGTENKSNLGANAILGVSLAVAQAAAKEKKMPLFRSIYDNTNYLMPCPMVNVINGGAHAGNMLDVQEFMIRPIKAQSFASAIRISSEVFHCLKKMLKKQKLSISVGDEGGFAPNISSDKEVLNILQDAISESGHDKILDLALDMAATEFYENGNYIEKKKKNAKLDYQKKSTSEQIEHIEDLCSKFPISSIEDGLSEEDWDGWESLTKKLGSEIQIVGDDLFVTNIKFLKKGIEKKVANAILIKLNQIGTLTETLQTIDFAKERGYNVIISHRSGETEDTFIADLAVAVNAGQIKTGSVCRSERVAKYNRLLEIEKELGFHAEYFSP